MHQTFAKPTSRAILKDAKRKAIEAKRRDVYRAVEQRDSFQCRCCTRRVVRTMEMRLNRLEHHHINGRGLKDSETTGAICILCLECHQQRHLTRVLHISGDADKLLKFERNGESWKG